MHTVLHERILFTNFIPKNAPLTTLSSPSNLIKGYGKAHIMLSNDTILTIDEALYSPHSERTLLSFKDIRDNNSHVETHVENGVEFLRITSYEYGQKRFLEKMECIPSGNLFTVHFADSHFYETVFPSLGGYKNVNVPDEQHELLWMTPTLSHLDPHTAQSENELQHILDLQSMPYAFTDLA
ncbi:uncharacterized protein [Pyrus communis]|uniref:uncharacterized protein n=1 Tax=Pyrus communis TaxID=23211 RepID=UPI0035BF28D4